MRTDFEEGGEWNKGDGGNERRVTDFLRGAVDANGAIESSCTVEQLYWDR